MKVVLHIGAPKTGSSTLQWFLANNRELLSDKGICYPDCEQELLGALYSSSVEVAPRLVRYRYKKDAAAASRDRDEIWRIIDEASAARPRVLILSSQYFFRHIDDDSVYDLKGRLNALGGNLQIIAYVRRHSDLFLSYTQQVLKLSHRFPKNINKNIKFSSHLARWEKHFPGSVHVFPYGRRQMVGGDVIKDFFFRIDPGLDFSHLVAGDRNESLSAEAMAILQKFNFIWYRNSNGQPKLGRKAFLQALSIVDKKDPKRRRPQLREDVIRSIDNACSEDVEILAKKWGVHLPRTEGKASELRDFREVSELCQLDKRRQRRLTLAAYSQWIPFFILLVFNGIQRRLKRIVLRHVSAT